MKNPIKLSCITSGSYLCQVGEYPRLYDLLLILVRPDTAPIANRLIDSYGTLLLEQVLRAIGGAVPLDRIRGERTGSISTVMFYFFKVAPYQADALERVLKEKDIIPDSVASLSLKHDLVMAIKLQMSNKDVVGLGIKVREFSRLCRLSANAGKSYN